MNKRFIVLAWSLLAIQGVFVVSAQDASGYYKDALFFSTTNVMYGSSARIQSLSGVQTSLGGDLSGVISNPAGLGVYNRGSFVITPAISSTNINSSFFNTSDESGYTGLRIASVGIGLKFGDATSEEKNKGGTFVISFNKLNSYYRKTQYSGRNSLNSIVDSFLENIGNTPSASLSGFKSGAFDQYLITPEYDTRGNLTRYSSFVSGKPFQTESITEKGTKDQLSLAYGGNFDDMFYYGAGVGIQFVNYSRDRKFAETNFSGPSPTSKLIRKILVEDYVHVKGIGINMNLGIIFKPTRLFRLGVSYTTPSSIWLDETSSFLVDADWANGTKVTEKTANGVDVEKIIDNINPYESNKMKTEYTLTTPSRLSLSGTFFLLKYGFISADVDILNYGKMKLRSNDFVETGDNRVIKDIYSQVLNIKFGAEIRISSKVSLRGGYSMYPSPSKNDDKVQKSHSVGVGYRDSNYFLDFSFTKIENNTFYSPYNLSKNQPIVNSSIFSNLVSVTFGYSF